MLTKEWPTVLEAFFGVKLTAAQVQMWEAELMDDISDLTKAEICRAIRARTWREDAKRFGKPTLRDLRIWIYQYRRDDKPALQGDTLADYKARINQAKDHDARWDIICEPRRDGENDELADYVKTRWPDFPLDEYKQAAWARFKSIRIRSQRQGLLAEEVPA